MKSVDPYLNFNGNTEEVFTFYRSVFGGELQLARFSDMDTGDMELTEEQKNGVAHVALPLGDSTLMGSDVPEAMVPSPPERISRSRSTPTAPRKPTGCSTDCPRAVRCPCHWGRWNGPSASACAPTSTACSG